MFNLCLCAAFGEIHFSMEDIWVTDRLVTHKFSEFLFRLSSGSMKLDNTLEFGNDFTKQLKVGCW